MERIIDGDMEISGAKGDFSMTLFGMEQQFNVLKQVSNAGSAMWKVWMSIFGK
ncbi:MAG TPA: hypothetical protein PLC07_00220 [Bacillota bacterium]|nr:hypothetical protein [Bacillota bacterium]HPT87420.1 hypothetical protein [Bacillota bacterium]